MRKRIITCLLISVIATVSLISYAVTSAVETSAIRWGLIRDGSEVPIADNIDGELTDSGGAIQFPQTGEYTLTATITDETGRVFTSSRSVTVQEQLNCDFNIQTINQHVSKSFVVVMDAAVSTGGKNITWTLTKGGVSASYTGSLNNNGGSINVDSVGSYSLKATIVDGLGNETTCTKTFTASNNAPNTPSITRTPNDAVVNKTDSVRITASASDPNGDTVTYVWENRPSEYYVYGLGSQTVRVKAVDKWGAESAWASTTFTTAYLQYKENSTFYYPSTEKTFNTPLSTVYISSLSFEYPWFNQRGGYTYKVIVEVYNKNTGLWENQSTVNLTTDYDSWGKGLASKIYTAVRFKYESNDPQLSSITLAITIKYHNP